MRRRRLPDTPVCQLITLVGRKVAVHLEERGKAMSWEVENFRSVESIEEIDDVEVEILLQPHDITLRTMEDLMSLLVSEHTHD